MHISRFVSTAVAFAALLCAASTAQAGIAVYTDQAAYLAAVGNTGVDTFDDLDLTDYTGPLNRSAGNFSYSISTGPNSSTLWGATDDYSDFWLTGSNRLDMVSFTSATPVAGAGGFFFGSDLFGSSAQAALIKLTAIDNEGTVFNYSSITPGLNSFVGFVSTGNLVSLTMATGDQPGVWATVNDLHLSAAAAAVPEPGTYSMLLGGLGLIGFMMRRKSGNT